MANFIKFTILFCGKPLGPEHREFYDRIFDAEIGDEVKDIIRLSALRESALDPSILFQSKNGSDGEQKKITQFVNSIFEGNPEVENRIYDELVRIVKEKFSRGEKTVIYSDLITGVTDKVRDLLEKEGIPTLVDNRRDIGLKQKLFQIEPQIGVIIGSPKSIGEGASYTSANNALFLMAPYEHYKIVQGIGRLLRPGQQHEDVNIFYLFGRDTIMEGILQYLLIQNSYF